MAKPPAFQMYAADFLVDVSEFNNEQVGAYTRLLLTQWVNGDLPFEFGKLANIVVTTEENFRLNIWPTIKVNFKLNFNNRYFNERLEETRQSKKQFSEGASLGGQVSAATKKAKKEGKPPQEIIYPWEDDQFTEKWAYWKNYKFTHYKFKYKSEISEQAALNALQKLVSTSKEAVELIEHAVSKQWQGIYKPTNWNTTKQLTKKIADKADENAYGKI